MKVVLDDGEQAVARLLAESRYSSNRGAGVVDRKIGPQSASETDLNGVGAEIAFCKMINVYPDLSISPRSGGRDLVMPNGACVDVKTTKYPDGMLLATLKKTAIGVDVFVLVVGQMPEYTYIGWQYRDVLINKNSIVDLGYGPTYGLEQWELIKTVPVLLAYGDYMEMRV